MSNIFYLFLIIHLILCVNGIMQFRNKRRYCQNKVNPQHVKDNNLGSRDADLQEDLEDDTEKDKETCIFHDRGEISNHLPIEQCSFDLDMKGKVINPYTRFQDCYKADTSLKSACIRCAACLAVAENINKTITDAYYDQQGVGPQTNNSGVCRALEDLCSHGFKNYDLRESDGNVSITKASVRNNHVSSKLNGKWTRILREMCQMYVRHVDVRDVLHKYKSGTINFLDYTCKGDGIFRDCKNLGIERVVIPSIEDGGDLSFQISVNCM